LQVVVSCNIVVEACWSLVDVTLMLYNDVTQGCHLFYFQGILVINSLKTFSLYSLMDRKMHRAYADFIP